MNIEEIKNEVDTNGIEIFEISESVDAGFITLDAIMAEIPGECAGKRCVESLINASKRHGALGIDLIAFPTKDDDSPVTGQDILNLMEWYKQFGFVAEYKAGINPDEIYVWRTGFDSFFSDGLMTLDF